jgi:trans-aconitate methyltransferase
VYRTLFDLIPAPRAKARALDIGCGVGRWTRFLLERRYQPVGIDFSPTLIHAARRRNPNLAFHCTSIQDYVPEEPFDLVSSVEVLQHNPFEQQEVAARRIREALRDGGYLIVLEGVNENHPRQDAFFRTIDDWVEMFENAGFRKVAIRRYYYNMILTAVGWLASILRRPEESSRDELLNPEELAIKEMAVNPKGGYVRNLVKRLVVRLDASVESVLVRANLALPHYNCGFLFQAV